MKLVLDLQGAQTESRFRGIGRQVLSLAKAIIAQNVDHEIVALLNGRLSDDFELLIADLSTVLPADHIKIFEVPGAVAERHPENLWRTHAAELVREAAIARLQPDVVHLGSLFEGYVDDAVTSVGRMRSGYATAVTLHDLIPLMNPNRYLLEEGPRRHWFRRAQSLKRADLLVSVSESSKQEAITWLQIPAERIAVISAGVSRDFRHVDLTDVDLSTLRARYNLDAPFVFYVGAVDPRKNVELIFEAFAQLPQNLRESHLIAFAGEIFEEEIGKLRLAAARHGVEVGRLRFCKYVPDQDLSRLYQACAAFVFPSTHEGFGLPALEAMACGAPVLASNASSIPEVVGNPAFLFAPHDAGDLARKLIPLLSDRQARRAAQAWGLERAARFTWDESARRALEAFEALHARHTVSLKRRDAELQAPVPPIARRLRLAFLSPLPPERTGIADYSAELLRELGRFYEIECVVGAEGYNDPWILSNFVMRDLSFFERNADRYDRIIYSVGNSSFHAHMLGLMERFAGVVILHDFFLGDLIDWMSGSGLADYSAFARELYRTHGVSALVAEKRDGRRAAVDRFPCNGVVFRAARGVIVHSDWAVDRARLIFGDAAASRMSVIPHLRALRAATNRRAARERLGIAVEDFLVCSFGIITKRKCSIQVLRAWRYSKVGQRPGARLVFVGENQAGEYGADLKAEIDASRGAIIATVTGHASPAHYADYLAAADLAIQLRTNSRGETSGTILDCLAVGLPVLISDHGPAAELPDNVVAKLSEDLTIPSLASAIDELWRDREGRLAMAERGRAHIRDVHHPAAIGERFHAAIERYSMCAVDAAENALLGEVADLVLPVGPDRADLRRVSLAMARLQPRQGDRQILYDITVLAEQDARTGIQRVVRGILRALIERPPAGYRIEVVRMDHSGLRYARNFLGRLLEIPSAVLPDDICSSDAGDIYLSIDWVPDRLPDLEQWLSAFRRSGGRVVIGVHDLLPFQFPQFFPDFMPVVTRRWFESSLRIADQFVCVSATVADDVIRFGRALMGEHRRLIAVDVFHNAADIDASLPSRGLPPNAAAILGRIAARPTFLMVGTVEPRKGHIQVLRGFERLWSEGVDVGLVIVGKTGWMMDDFAAASRAHPEWEHRLTWLRGISDEFLIQVYRAVSAVIAASEGEGFGLPLIEAALHGTAIVARDIPVFREVAGHHAFYFSGNSPDHIADAMRTWLSLSKDGLSPTSADMPVKSWRQSAADLVDAIFTGRHYGEIT